MGGRTQYLKWRYKIEAFEGNSIFHIMEGCYITPEEIGNVRGIKLIPPNDKKY
jgi:hypothetical protein